jgi:hypothetical protein
MLPNGDLGAIPLLFEEGWLRPQPNAGAAHKSAADGVVAHNSCGESVT